MRGVLMYGPRDVRVEERAKPEVVEPTDAVLRLAATCVCGSDLWPYRGADARAGAHEAYRAMDERRTIKALLSL